MALEVIAVVHSKKELLGMIEQSKKVEVVDIDGMFSDRKYKAGDLLVPVDKTFVKSDVDYDTTDHLHNKKTNYGKTLVRRNNQNKRR